MNEQLNIDKVSVRYQKHEAVKQASFQLQKGEIACLLGPSGCGKTSLLRSIAGFEPISHGKIRLKQQLISSASMTLAPEHRKVGMVFQDFALFPHMTIEKNIGFGLSNLDKHSVQARVAELLELIDLKPYAKSFPHQLSGGQQQRVALARAMAPKPDMLLLDEPFSNLDSELREQLASDVRLLLKEHAITSVMVTHDQHEAFAIADSIAVMNNGVIQQWDSAYNLYHKPNNEFVARFIGQGSLLQSRINQQMQIENHFQVTIDVDAKWKAGDTIKILIRPDDIVYSKNSSLCFPIARKVFRGAEYLYELILPDDQRISCRVPSHVNIKVGDQLPIEIDLKHLVIFSVPVNSDLNPYLQGGFRA